VGLYDSALKITHDLLADMKIATTYTTVQRVAKELAEDPSESDNMVRNIEKG
jgi:hypothetical protein